MNSDFQNQRSALLQQMAALTTMEEGSLKAEFRLNPAGEQVGPYFKHQVWRDGANVTQRIPAAEAPALQAAIANRQQFEALAAAFVEVTVGHTRQDQFSAVLKKKILPARSPRKPKSPR